MFQCEPSDTELAHSLLSIAYTMNKRTKTTKLRLNHETVRALDDKQLTVVAGGTGEYFSKLSDCIFNQCVQQ